MSAMDVAYRDIVIDKAIRFAFNNPPINASSMTKKEAIIKLKTQTENLEHVSIELNAYYSIYEHLDMPYEYYLKLFKHILNCVNECQKNEIRMET